MSIPGKENARRIADDREGAQQNRTGTRALHPTSHYCSSVQGACVRTPVHTMSRTMLSVVQEAEALFNARNTFVVPTPEEEDPDDTVAFFINLARQCHRMGESSRVSKATMTTRSAAETTRKRRGEGTMLHRVSEDNRHSTKTHTHARKKYTGLQDTPPPRRDDPRLRKGGKPQRTRSETYHQTATYAMTTRMPR